MHSFWVPLSMRGDRWHGDDQSEVNAALMRLARYVTLLLDDVVSFTNVLGRNVDLEKVYLTAGWACKPLVALVAISKATEVWIDKSEA